jgi:hypothetical protein
VRVPVGSHEKRSGKRLLLREETLRSLVSDGLFCEGRTGANPRELPFFSFSEITP